MINLDTTTPIARTSHQCEVCGPGIAVGDRYSRTVSIGGGDFSVFKSCIHPCSAVVDKCWQQDFYDHLHGGVTGENAREWAIENPDDPDAAALIAKLQRYSVS